MQAVAPAGKPLVVLLKNGRALELRGTVKESEAILVTWSLGAGETVLVDHTSRV